MKLHLNFMKGFLTNKYKALLREKGNACTQQSV
jgi:hypothetical protein